MELKKEILRYIKLNCGLFICALGIVTLLNAKLGIPAWDVLNQGISLVTNEAITIGQASIVVGVFIVILDVILGQPIGMGTVINFLFVGIYMDFIISTGYIPKPEGLVLKLLQAIIGIFFYTYGTYLYMVQELGCGPRDGMMQILTARLNKPVSLIKNGTEIIVLIIGWFLGGDVGVVTIVNALLMGVLLQKMFEIGKVDLKTLKHRNLATEIKLFKNFIKSKI